MNIAEWDNKRQFAAGLAAGGVVFVVMGAASGVAFLGTLGFLALVAGVVIGATSLAPDASGPVQVGLPPVSTRATAPPASSTVETDLWRYEWVLSKPRHVRPERPSVITQWADQGWQVVDVTTRPGIFGGLFGTTATWVLMRRSEG